MANEFAPVSLTPQLRQCLDELPTAAAVLDVGCAGWKLHRAKPTLAHHGCDLEEIPPPAGATFHSCNIDHDPLPWPDDSFDLVVAAHLIEHLQHPIEAFEEMVRVCKPGGHIYLEMPSDLSGQVSIRNAGISGFYNFWDDPTHQRPWSPRSIFRLMVGCNCIPVETDYIGGKLLDRIRIVFERLRYRLTGDDDRLTNHWWRATRFICFGIGRKPSMARGKQSFHYVSLKGKTTKDVIAMLEERNGPSE